MRRALVAIAAVALVLSCARGPKLPEGLQPVSATELRLPLATLTQQLWLGKPVDPLSAFRQAVSAEWPELDVRDARELSGQRRPPMVVVAVRGPEEKGDETAPDLRLSWVLRADAPDQLRRSQAVVGALLRSLGAGMVRDVVSERAFNAEGFIAQRVTNWADSADARVRSFVTVERDATRGMRAFGLPELAGGDAELLTATSVALVSGQTPDERGRLAVGNRTVTLARQTAPSGPELERVTVVPN